MHLFFVHAPLRCPLHTTGWTFDIIFAVCATNSHHCDLQALRPMLMVASGSGNEDSKTKNRNESREQPVQLASNLGPHWSTGRSPVHWGDVRSIHSRWLRRSPHLLGVYALQTCLRIDIKSQTYPWASFCVQLPSEIRGWPQVSKLCF